MEEQTITMPAEFRVKAIEISDEAGVRTVMHDEADGNYSLMSRAIPSWMSASPLTGDSGTTVTIKSLSENDTANNRSATLLFSVGSGETHAEATLPITQSGLGLLLEPQGASGMLSWQGVTGVDVKGVLTTCKIIDFSVEIGVSTYVTIRKLLVSSDGNTWTDSQNTTSILRGLRYTNPNGNKRTYVKVVFDVAANTTFLTRNFAINVAGYRTQIEDSGANKLTANLTMGQNFNKKQIKNVTGGTGTTAPAAPSIIYAPSAGGASSTHIVVYTNAKFVKVGSPQGDYLFATLINTAFKVAAFQNPSGTTITPDSDGYYDTGTTANTMQAIRFNFNVQAYTMAQGNRTMAWTVSAYTDKNDQNPTTVICSIGQTAPDAYISLSKEQIVLDSDANSQDTVVVTENVPGSWGAS